MTKTAPSLHQVELTVAAPDKETYVERLEALQKKLYALQVRTFVEKRWALFVFEGWDAAGKGGAIRNLTALLDPRGYQVWPIGAPSEDEKRRHYLWRFASRTPVRGEIGIFDRSWYGRVLVERVEKYASKPEWKRAYAEINDFERALADDGMVIGKFFLHIDAQTQLKRFREREKDPVKHFKIGPDDWRNRKQRPQYEKAIDEMFERTHHPHAPWLVVPANDKRHARLTVLEACIKALDT